LLAHTAQQRLWSWVERLKTVARVMELVVVGFGVNEKGKVFPYLLPSVGPGADPGVQAVSPQVT